MATRHVLGAVLGAALTVPSLALVPLAHAEEQPTAPAEATASPTPAPEPPSSPAPDSSPAPEGAPASDGSAETPSPEPQPGDTQPGDTQPGAPAVASVTVDAPSAVPWAGPARPFSVTVAVPAGEPQAPMDVELVFDDSEKSGLFDELLSLACEDETGTMQDVGLSLDRDGRLVGSLQPGVKGVVAPGTADTTDCELASPDMSVRDARAMKTLEREARDGDRSARTAAADDVNEWPLEVTAALRDHATDEPIGKPAHDEFAIRFLDVTVDGVAGKIRAGGEAKAFSASIGNRTGAAYENLSRVIMLVPMDEDGEPVDAGDELRLQYQAEDGVWRTAPTREAQDDFFEFGTVSELPAVALADGAQHVTRLRLAAGSGAPAMMVGVVFLPMVDELSVGAAFSEDVFEVVAGASGGGSGGGDGSGEGSGNGSSGGSGGSGSTGEGGGDATGDGSLAHTGFAGPAVAVGGLLLGAGGGLAVLARRRRVGIDPA